MKIIIGTQLRCAKELTQTTTGGRFSVVASLYDDGETEDLWLTCFVSGEAYEKAKSLYSKEGRMPPGINITGELSGLTVFNDKPSFTVNVKSLEPSYGFGGSSLILTATNVGIGKDLWRNSKGNFSRTCGALEFYNSKTKESQASWIDLKFLGTMATLADKLKIGKGSFANISGTLSEAKVVQQKGGTFLNVSLDVSSLKRVNKHSKGYKEAEDEDYEMPMNLVSSEPTVLEAVSAGRADLIFEKQEQAFKVDRPAAEIKEKVKTDNVDDFLSSYGFTF